MSLCINILLPNGHRRNFKLSPSTIVSQTLEDVCKREGYCVEKYSFLFQRKVLDETLLWRYANVPNNAKLELIKHEKLKQKSPIRIALQYGDGERLQGTFKPSTSLSEILDYWKEKLSHLEYPDNFEPCIVYVRQEILGKPKLSNTTLKGLGLTSGSAVMRLSFKPVDTSYQNTQSNDMVSKNEKTVMSTPETDSGVCNASTVTKPLSIPQKIFKTPPTPQATPVIGSAKSSNSGLGFITQDMLSQALAQVSDESLGLSASSGSLNVVTSALQFEENEPMAQDKANTSTRTRNKRPDSKEMPRKRHKQASPPPEPQPDFSNFKFPEETAGMTLYAQESNDEELSIEPLSGPCERNEIIFDERTVPTGNITSEDPGDEFFELTIDDIRRMISDLRSLQNEAADKPLVTARSREIQRLRAIRQYPKIIIRIIFPNRKILQGFFRPAEQVEVLYNFVSKYLSIPMADVYLYTAPPKVVLEDKSAILHDCSLSPASKVYLGLKNGDFHPDLFSENVESISGTDSDANSRLAEVFEMKVPGSRRQPTSEMVPMPPTTSSANDHASSSGQQASRNHPSGARPKVPKWFKMGKK